MSLSSMALKKFEKAFHHLLSTDLDSAFGHIADKDTHSSFSEQELFRAQKNMHDVISGLKDSDLKKAIDIVAAYGADDSTEVQAKAMAVFKKLLGQLDRNHAVTIAQTALDNEMFKQRGLNRQLKDYIAELSYSEQAKGFIEAWEKVIGYDNPSYLKELDATLERIAPADIPAILDKCPIMLMGTVDYVESQPKDVAQGPGPYHLPLECCDRLFKHIHKIAPDKLKTTMDVFHSLILFSVATADQGHLFQQGFEKLMSNYSISPGPAIKKPRPAMRANKERQKAPVRPDSRKVITFPKPKS